MNIKDVKVGDRVRVKDNDGAKLALSLVDEYEVTKITCNYIEVRNVSTDEPAGMWFPKRFTKINTWPAPKPPSLPPHVEFMSLDSATIFAIVQAHIKDMYNITQEISSIECEYSTSNMLRISFKQEDKSVTS